MALSSSDNLITPLILDTSAIINLHASNNGADILSCFGCDIWVSHTIRVELERSTQRGSGELYFLDNIVKNNIARLTHMSTSENSVFGSLTATPPTVDDGEAATIAIAASRAFTPVIDDQKGRARAESFAPPLVPVWSLDLFRDRRVVSRLGMGNVTEAIFQALRVGRMRIPEVCADEVIRQIGYDRARECTSLPNYRLRFKV